MQDELELLESMYGLDGSFQRDPSTPGVWSFKLTKPEGSASETSSISLRFELPEKYPESSASIRVGVSSHDTAASVGPAVSEAIKRIPEELLKTAQEADGGMTVFAMLEAMRSRWDELTAPPASVSLWESSSMAMKKRSEGDPLPETTAASKVEQPKAQKMTKGQKRRMWDRAETATGATGRGYGWVDILSHLSKTGAKK